MLESKGPRWPASHCAFIALVLCFWLLLAPEKPVQPQALQGTESSASPLVARHGPGARVSVSLAELPCAGIWRVSTGATACLGPSCWNTEGCYDVYPIPTCWSAHSCVGVPTRTFYTPAVLLVPFQLQSVWR